jgi:hypothetical protein
MQIFSTFQKFINSNDLLINQAKQIRHTEGAGAWAIPINRRQPVQRKFSSGDV